MVGAADGRLAPTGPPRLNAAVANPPFPSLDAKEHPLADVVFLFTLIAFFALAVLFVGACERIIGPDDAEGQSSATDAAPERVPERVSA